ncbi:MAG: hypothetical protein KOO61_08295 [Spirochaetales bacterium]|nr:hypothetical protein [Spirochaetales bacterium]
MPSTSELFDKLFESARKGQKMSVGETMIYLAWLKTLEDREKAEMSAAQRLVDWYQRDREQIVAHLRLVAGKTFPQNETKEWQFPVLNEVPRTIKRLSLAYKKPATRKLARKGEELKPDAKEYELVFGENGMYRHIKIDRKMKELDRFSTLLNTVHAEVVPRKGAIDWDIRLRPSVMIVEDPDDYLNFVKFAYRWAPLDPETLKTRVGWVVWTAEHHMFIVDGEDKPIGMSKDDLSNPYAGEIPVVTVRKLELDDYWGRFGADLVDGIEAVNLQLANMWENAFLQTHGMRFTINCGFTEGSVIKQGPKHGVDLDGLTADDMRPEFGYVKPDNDIPVVQDLIKFFLDTEGQGYGMPAGGWSEDQVPESGFAKFLKNIELLENRDDDVQIWEEIEQQLFDKSRMVYNAYCKPSEKIPEDLELRVTYPEISFPESPTEKDTRWMLRIKAGLASLVDYYMQEEGLDEEQALERAKKVAKHNAEIREAAAPEYELPGSPRPGEEDGDEE